MKGLNGFLGAALHFAALDIAVHASMEAGLKEVVKRIEKTAKDEIGHYQPSIGPFNAWDPLADSTEEDKARKGFEPNAPLERTGQFRDSWKSEAEGKEGVVGSTDERAPWFEFGTTKMPPRPVLGPAVIHNSAAIKKIIGKATVHGIVGGKRVHPDAGYDDLI
jgi:HK97 gp10 family phage protein